MTDSFYSGPLSDAYSKLGTKGKAAADVPRLEYELGAEERKVSQSKKAAEAKLYSEYAPALFSKPIEEFKPSQEDMSGFAALGSLLAVSGAMMGMKGKTAGIMAMNAISGMMKGYQQGRKDLYEQERQKFEENMKVHEKQRAQIKEAFDIALKMAPTNMRGAEEFLNKTLRGLGAELPAQMVSTSGITNTAGVINQLNANTEKNLSAIQQKTGPSRVEALRKQLAETKGIQAGLAAEEKETTGALEWVKLPDGTVDRMTAKEVERRRKDLGENIQYIPTPTSKAAEPSYGSELGPVGKTAYNELTADKQKSFDEFYKGLKPGTDDKKEIRANFESRNETEELAKYVAQNQDAVNYLAKTFQTRAEYFKSIYDAFTKAQTPEQIAAATRQADAAEQQLVNDMTRDSQSNDPKIKDVASRATVLAKMLQRASLADAAAIGRPTVFLERMTGKWYDQGVRPDTLMSILYSRAKDADTRLENYQLGAANTKPEIQFNKYPLLTRGPDALITRYGQPPSFPNEKAAYQILKQRGYKKGDVVRGYVDGELVDIEVE